MINFQQFSLLKKFCPPYLVYKSSLYQKSEAAAFSQCKLWNCLLVQSLLCVYMIYSLLIDKDFHESQNMSIKFLCLSSRDLFIFSARLSLLFLFFKDVYKVLNLIYTYWIYGTHTSYCCHQNESECRISLVMEGRGKLCHCGMNKYKYKENFNLASGSSAWCMWKRKSWPKWEFFS